MSVDSLLSPISIAVPLPRTFFQQSKPPSKTIVPHNLLSLDPCNLNAVTWPEVHFLTEQLRLSIQGQYYCLRSGRSEQRLFSRNSQGQLLGCIASMNGKAVVSHTLERCTQDQTRFHLNMLTCLEDTATTVDYYLQQNASEPWDYCDMKAVNQGKQVLIVGRAVNKCCYQLMLFDFVGGSVVASTELYLNREFSKTSEKLMRLIKSEYGDVLYFFTTLELYEVEIDHSNCSISVKPIDFWRRIQMIRTKKEEQYPYDQNILDMQFIPNSLKIMALTSLKELFIIQTQNCLFQCDFINQLKKQQCSKVDWNTVSINKLYTVNELIVLQFEEENKGIGLIVMKIGSKVTLVRNLIELPFSRDQLQSLLLQSSTTADEIYVQYILKKSNSLIINKYKLIVPSQNLNQHLQVHEFIGSRRVGCHPSLTHPCPQTPLIKKALICPTACTIFILNQRQLCCYKMPTLGVPVPTKLFTQSFFQRPLLLAVSPTTLNFVLVFKQFIRLMCFGYTSCRFDLALQLRNVGAVGYSPSGKSLVICAEGRVHLLNAYSFRSTIPIEGTGEVTQLHFVNEDTLIVRCAKGIALYEGICGVECVKRMEVRMKETSHFAVGRSAVVVMRHGALEVYSFRGEIVGRRRLQQRVEEVTGMQVSEMFGLLLFSTVAGAVKQCLWPIDQNSGDVVQVYSQNISQQSIIQMRFSSEMGSLYIVSEDGVIMQSKCRQYLNGVQMKGVYGIVRRESDLLWQSMDLLCLLQQHTPIYLQTLKQLENAREELQFINDKNAGDGQQMQRVQSSVEREGLQGMMSVQRENGVEVQAAWESEYKERARDYALVNEEVKRSAAERRVAEEKEREQYKECMLKIYVEKERLMGILDHKTKELQQEKKDLEQVHQRGYRALYQEGQMYMRLKDWAYDKAIKLQEDGQDQRAALGEEEEIRQCERHKEISLMLERELKEEDDRKFVLLATLTQLEKENANFYKRADKFQSGIMERKLDISKRRQESEDCARMKMELSDKLIASSERITHLENEMVGYLKSIQERKAAKITHQFQLEEYQNEVGPAESQYNALEDNVRRMNAEIMEVYQRKVNAMSALKEAEIVLKNYKEQNLKLLSKKSIVKTKLQRVLEAVNGVDVYQVKDLKVILKQLCQRVQARSERPVQSAQEQQMNRLLKRKLLIKKELQLEEKNEEQIRRNQHQIYKYHVQNTQLVREVNELRKANGQLAIEQEMILRKIEALRQSFVHENKRTRSIHVVAARSACKLTPYQRHEMEVHKETVETKTSTGGQSSELLHGLLSDIKLANQNRLNKMDVIRDRVRTFVNPQIKPKKLFRSRISSDKLKL